MDRIYLVLFTCLYLPIGSPAQSPCRLGWAYHQSACYRTVFVGTGTIPWYEAQAHCRAMGANLTSIHSVEEQDFVSSTTGKSGNYAIGIHRFADTNEVGWTDGSPVDYTKWASGYPGTGGCGGYIDIGKNFRWYLYSCDHTYAGYVCRMPIPDELRYHAATYGIFVPETLRNALRPSLVLEEREVAGGAAWCAVECTRTAGCRGYNYGAPRCQLLAVNIRDDNTSEILVRDDSLMHYYLV